jgi:hypothetical protein
MASPLSPLRYLTVGYSFITSRTNSCVILFSDLNTLVTSHLPLCCGFYYSGNNFGVDGRRVGMNVCDIIRHVRTAVLHGSIRISERISRSAVRK